VPSGSLELVANAQVFTSAPQGGCLDPIQGTVIIKNFASQQSPLLF